MRVSYKWLSEYIDLSGVTPEELAEKITRSGIEVDVVEPRNRGVTNTVVGYVESKEKHPDADKLNVCTVDVGETEKLQIVCGAPNVDAGQKVPVALVGAKLPGGLKIKKAKLRGVESRGMICSAKELGINDKLLPKEQQDGIMVLPDSWQIGEDVIPLLGLDDVVLELDLTPNRSDCLSMMGVAYEVAAILGREVREPDLTVTEQGDEIDPKVSVRIDAPDHCYRYSARLIENVTLGPSPMWMQNRLIAAGIRPINNVVDITNYVMLEQGQPLHAFDYEAVFGGNIVVRLAQEGETIVTLDDVERTLDPEMLLITDGDKPIGIAGVMGGANSEVTENTRTILLESAHFAGASIRKTSRKLGLRSEASLRFEKDVDPEGVMRALERATQLMVELAGGKVAKGISESVLRGQEPAVVELNLNRLNKFLGMTLSRDTVADILRRLNFDFEETGDQEGTVFQVKVPTRRQDIRLEEDLFEEVARLYGYDEIPTTLPVTVTTPGSLTREQYLRRQVRRILNSMGMKEAMTYTFTSPSMADDVESVFGNLENSDYQPIPLAMPMSEERSVLRVNLLPHLMETAAYNRNRRLEDVAVFEVGNIFLSEEKQLTSLPEERLVLGGLLTGHWVGDHWLQNRQPVDFYLTRGILDALFERLNVDEISYRPVSGLKGMHPGRTADIYVAQERIGYVGQLHPEVQKKYDLGETYVFQLELEKLFARVKDYEMYRPLPRFPAINRDLAVVVDGDLAHADLQAKIREAGGKWLESVHLFDVYSGEGIEEGKKSMAFSLVYRDPEKTLTDEEVNEVHDGVVRVLEEAFGARLR
ncbi:MAG: phenylalanine--tRNA ligase subunit beta [Bacillaceae bacterium]|nr:phenylalanine--tRNA ligase subunit beta [Bacillaceae bacterium]